MLARVGLHRDVAGSCQRRTMTMALADAVFLLHPDAPVAIARRELEPGTELHSGGRDIVVRDTVPCGHKLALTDVAEGAEVHKYGLPIGVATRTIAAGDHVHEHNLRSLSRSGLPVGTGASSGSPDRSEVRR